MSGRILIGTSSWTDPTLVKEGNFYPPGTTSAEARLKFYASRFPLVEVDSTYYYPPSEKNSVLWIERTPPEFTFNIKAYSLLTNHPTKVDSLYNDIKAELPAGDAREAERVSRQTSRRGGRRGVAAVPRRADAAALGREARRCAVPVPAVVRDREEEQGVHRGVRGAPPRLSGRCGVPPRVVDERAQPRGEPLVPGGAEPTVRLRRHAAGLRLERAADRRGDGRRPGDGAVPRTRPRSVDREERERIGPLPLRLLGDELQEWVPRIEQLASRPARPTCS